MDPAPRPIIVQRASLGTVLQLAVPWALACISFGVVVVVLVREIGGAADLLVEAWRSYRKGASPEGAAAFPPGASVALEEDAFIELQSCRLLDIAIDLVAGELLNDGKPAAEPRTVGDVLEARDRILAARRPALALVEAEPAPERSGAEPPGATH